ncbi:MAG: DNA/RNA nuclease SfsA [Thiohalomonadaceae bacterium]
MTFDPPLIEGVLLRRYKRFLADVQLPDGSVITAHTPNTGSMLGCCDPGSRVWLRDSGSGTRKYPHTWELVETLDGVPVGINTSIVNTLVIEAIGQGVVGDLSAYRTIRQEVRYGQENSRVDLLLTDGPDGRDCYVEIKNVTARDDTGFAMFPDAVSVRGAKHLRELAAVAAAGHRAVIFFCVQRDDVHGVRPADEIDPAYGRALREARAAGVEAMACAARVNPESITLERPLPVFCP